jgi:glycosyltransferase involved in cell wall biosynthesis
VWVTSEFAARTFRRSGVAPEALRVVWPSIDTDLFRTDGPARRRPESLENRFVFLSVLEWQQRKGWDVLLRAFASELAADDSVGLLLKVTCLHGQSREQIRDEADAVLRECGLTGSGRPEIVWMFDVLDAEEMAALYRGADAFVLPSRGEGWGRPYMEALACGLPVIATAASGQADFLHDENALLIPAAEADVPESAAREIPTYRGARWLEPDENALRAAMRQIATCPQTREKLVRRGLQDVAERFGPSAARERIESALAAAESRFAPLAAPPVEPAQIRVQLEGEFFAGHSFSNINERLARGFAADPSLALSIQRRFGQPCDDEQIPGAHELRPWIGRQLPGGPEITIRHAFPPNWQPLSGGNWVHIQPWEFGHLPSDWIEPLRDRVDEIWAPTEYVRRVYERSGIPIEKIQVIPWGIDPDLFSPEAPPLHLAAETVQGNISEGTFKFLFVGGTIHRKGFDRLLEAYLAEFTRDDDVCLVIKDQGTDTFYRYGNGREAIQSALSGPNNPKLVYLDRAMTPGQLASLYAACDCLAMPYRGEGFGLPILEAMACGLAVIVPRGGASDDFVDQTTGLLLPAREVETTHDWPLFGPALELQVDPADLRRALRRAYEDRDETAAMGAAAARHARQNFSWTRSLAAMRERMRILIGDRSQENSPRGMCLAACVRFSGADQFAQDPSAAWNLSECLARLRPFVDELLVVGDHLPRAYQAIAGEYGARCVAGRDDDAASNESRAFDWSLSIEGGEQVNPEDLRPLRGILAAQPPSVRQLQIKSSQPGTNGDAGRYLSVVRRSPEDSKRWT